MGFQCRLARDPGLAQSRERVGAALNRNQVATLCRNAFEAAWLPEADKQEYLEHLDAYLAQP